MIGWDNEWAGHAERYVSDWFAIEHLLSDSENESDDEVIPDLDNIFIEEDIVESSDESDREETGINSVVVTEEVDRVLKSVECVVEAEYDKEMNRILTFDCKCRGS